MVELWDSYSVVCFLDVLRLDYENELPSVTLKQDLGHGFGYHRQTEGTSL